MRLKRLTFEDKGTGWRLEDLPLAAFNVLVGASGAGKTRILRAISSVFAIVQDRVDFRDHEQGVRFDLRFELDGRDYTWRFENADLTEGDGSDPLDEEGLGLPIVHERLECEGQTLALVDRTHERFLSMNKEFPGLARSTSALVLVAEPVIQRIHHAFSQLVVDAERRPGSQTILFDKQGPLAARLSTFESFRSQTRIHPIFKAFLLQERFPREFTQFKRAFTDIFPTVEDVAVEARKRLGSLDETDMSFKLKERGVAKWFQGAELSSGMNRVLHHLVDVMLAPAGTVVLIDEFENSLGADCMGPLTKFLLSRVGELQFIITSHNPSFLDGIPKKHWKLVRRQGNTVRVTPVAPSG